ncbi:hypothetical protein HanRHA438_Chr06g0251211 [Helianthus annuus]|uniref:Uncharacterized protein n=1 Tax=Helianthus annuus TaxID=4232 RepID=A0A9K3IQ40_HELAN|nr:hypothetical protein HanXRQr2_Chr06g0242161 [Helianthus annuus]KAJ0910335.1 hypothetical protein HanRHA438_Chr06g0251211 [Helianthus annuus]KAJ0914010.1 hypothetical protein HanPSC8_Chr06g0233781 [Helianthus annuus]
MTLLVFLSTHHLLLPHTSLSLYILILHHFHTLTHHILYPLFIHIHEEYI